MGRATYTPQSTLTMPVCQKPMYERRRASAGSMRAAGTVGCVSAGIGSGEHSSLQVDHLHQYTHKVHIFRIHELPASSLTGSYMVYCRHVFAVAIDEVKSGKRSPSSEHHKESPFSEVTLHSSFTSIFISSQTL